MDTSIMDTSPAQITLSVIYVNYNTSGLLLQSLDSLKANLSVDHEIIIVDNASTAPLDERAVRELAPDAAIHRSPSNLGFGQGNNLGARSAQGRFLWFLNTDTIVPPANRLELAVDWLEHHAEYGAVLPMLVDGSGKIQKTQSGKFPTALRMIADKLGIRGALNYTDPSASHDVDSACCAALLVRSDAFRGVRGFSPEYFFFLEDTDLNKKLDAAGWRTRLMVESRIVHLEGGSMGDEGARKRLYYQHLDIYFAKWHSVPERAIVRALALPMKVRYHATRLQQGRRSLGSARP